MRRSYRPGRFSRWIRRREPPVCYPGRTVDAQASLGRHIDASDLEPGDVVFLANTFQYGFSHNGIYVGGGRFLHAQDGHTGVIVSPLLTGYRGRHDAGARRPP